MRLFCENRYLLSFFSSELSVPIKSGMKMRSLVWNLITPPEEENYTYIMLSTVAPWKGIEYSTRDTITNDSFFLFFLFYLISKQELLFKRPLDLLLIEIV